VLLWRSVLFPLSICVLSPLPTLMLCYFVFFLRAPSVLLFAVVHITITVTSSCVHLVLLYYISFDLLRENF
jgi:hypothetical protein